MLLVVQAIDHLHIHVCTDVCTCIGTCIGTRVIDIVSTLPHGGAIREAHQAKPFGGYQDELEVDCPCNSITVSDSGLENRSKNAAG